MIRNAFAFALAFSTTGVALSQLTATPTASFRNPIFPGTGQDPAILRWNGMYYLVQSRGGIRVFASPTLSGLRNAKGTVVWSGQGDLDQLWAPELVALDGKFYIYVAAAHGGRPPSRRMYVLEANTPTGPYTFKGQIKDPTDLWAIDGTVLEEGGKRYFVWSGWEAQENRHEQRLYIARMSNPWTIEGKRYELSRPDRPWERIGGNAVINEGPEPLQHNGRTFIVYSASHSVGDDYCLGVLSYKSGGEITDRKSWVKSDGCQFAKNPASGVYGPGHNIFVPSPDGKETWNVYHAIATSGCGWKCRTIRMQKVTWRADGTPDFGVPLPLSAELPAPSGE